jgi:malate dehydrogenase (oxaloacetate-decarboxylating)(NADP+)
VESVIGLKRGAKLFAAMNVLLLPQRVLAIADTYVNDCPAAPRSPRSP